MSSLRKRFERFCYKNQNKGIPNLMLYIVSGNALVYLISLASNSFLLFNLLCFSRSAIFHGQIWRLITYPLALYPENMLFFIISSICYYSIGRAMERLWGTFKFNLFYLTGVLLMDVYSLIFGCQASAYYLNLSLFLSYATLFPQATFLFMFIIPIKAWFFALFNLALVLVGVLTPPFTAYNLFPLIALANYFLFFGSDILELVPYNWRRKLKLGKSKPVHSGPAKVIVFRPSEKKEVPAYNHRCTICGRTDVSNPELEFRYCSKCNGYYCYCQDHISNHAHITE